MTWAEMLPLIFVGLLGFTMFVYVVLDGFDLGVGMLMHRANPTERDQMIASIGPFWDANETWLVLGIGILLIAFPKANSLILGALYLPVMFMLVGLIVRGVAFDFRVKAREHHQLWWNWAFIGGSTLAAAMQGYMLGRYVTGFADGWSYWLFAVAIAVAVPAVYTLLGACWLIIKTEGELQDKAIAWAKLAWWPVVAGMILISLASPWVSPAVYERWFSMPEFIGLLPIPLATASALIALRWILNMPDTRGALCWMPFALLIGALVMGALGLAYSMYPYVVIGQLTAWEAASSTAALNVILIGVSITVPTIIAYSLFAFWVFRGKVRDLTYG
ncbi:MAG: cytochrome d ubiquinol oxidase subunit II [Pseudomonadota bacterium]|nr:cytochrome d ubiquinol oxidase subunit II [Pseudomonadota bacterium]